MAVHYWEGPANNKIGFVLSTPGKDEENAECPAAGVTGDNMNAILTHLNNWNPIFFSSADRYHYLITNASTKIMHAAKDDGKTQDLDSNITARANVERLNKELAKCEIVILCGAKAHLLEQHLIGKIIVKTPHLGNLGLRNEYNNRHHRLKGINEGKRRDVVRQSLCAENIICQLEESLTTKNKIK
jgi:hypothetical protein